MSTSAVLSGNQSAPGPLSGTLVVSLEQAVAAPFCTARLAESGARVIKLERPEGDFARGYDTVVNGQSSYFVWLNRGKESVVVDLKQADDRDFVERLALRADVFVENLGPQTADRLGLSLERLRKLRPTLITCSITGYGAGPYAMRKAYDLLVQAESGLASVTGCPEAPGRVGVSVVDIATGLTAYAAVLEALIERIRTGMGRHVTISLFDTIAEWMAVPVLHLEGSGKAPARVGLQHPSIAPYGVYRCNDGREVLLSIQTPREWERFCRDVLSRPDMVGQLEFRDNDARVRNRSRLDAFISARFADFTAAECLRLLDSAGVAYGVVNSVSDLVGHPHFKRIQVDTPAGPVSVPASPLHPEVRHLELPTLGQHTDAVRREFS